MRSGRRTATVVAAALLLSAHLSHAAFAGFVDRTASPSMSISTATLAAPTNASAAPSCVLLAPRVTVSWTPSTSSFVAGYQIYRRSATGTTFSLVGSVTGGTSSYNDSTVVLGGSYVYVVHAVYASWSAASGQAAVTVPLLCA